MKILDLPRSKYSDPIHTAGKEFTLNGKNYVGWYVVTYQDKYYTGKSITRDSKEIFEVKLPAQSPAVYKVFVNQVVEPTLEDRANGIWKRYLIQKTVNRVIIEVTKERYQAFEQTPGYKITTLDWNIKGPAKDVKKGPYLYKGAENKNRETVQALEKNFPGISNYFKNYSEFVE